MSVDHGTLGRRLPVCEREALEPAQGALLNMTIYEYDSLSAGHDGDSPEGGLSTHALVDRLSAGEPYAVAFGGQGAAWLENLEELVSSAGIESELSGVVGEAELLL